MHAAAILVLLLALGAHAQGMPDPFEITQRYANSGAPRIALTRVEQLQPATPSGPRWSDWERLRCSLMYGLNLHRELTQRIASLPAAMPQEVARFCLLQGARAAIATGQGEGARDFLARLLWQQEMSADELRLARLLVIESYLAEDKPQDAYMLMLRFQQDYKPLGRDTAARFADALLATGMEKEAINWFSQLDEASPVKLLMRLAARLITPDAAIAQARAGLARNSALAAYWIVLQHAATLQKNRMLHVEALEHLLQLAGSKSPEGLATPAGELWKSYAAAAQDVANQDKLLLGDDANWADLAARRAGADPTAARTFLAQLSTQSRVRGTRLSAQLQLIISLQNGKLPLTALGLFSDATRFPIAQLDPQARYLLGSIAAVHDQPAVAARFWLGLSAPPAVAPDEWNLRLAQMLVRAGAADAGAAALRALIAGRQTLPPALMQRAILPVQELQDTGHYKTADELYRALLPLAGMQERRDILFGLGRIAETNYDFQRAADYFLEAALLVESRVADAIAINARIAAAANLGRAGMKDDARSQFSWLQKNVKDKEKLEQIRREMQKL